MRKKMKSSEEKQARRMQADREELIERVTYALPRDGKVEVRPGLVLTRLSSPTGPEYAVLEPWLCMIAQGAKDVMHGDEWYHYDPEHYLISTLGVPAVGRVVEASRERPYLASGKSFYLEVGDAAVVGGEDLLLKTFLDEIRELPPELLRSSRVGFRLKPADRERLEERIDEVLRDVAATPSDPDGEPWSLYLGLHPDVSGGPSG